MFFIYCLLRTLITIKRPLDFLLHGAKHCMALTFSFNTWVTHGFYQRWGVESENIGCKLVPKLNTNNLTNQWTLSSEVRGNHILFLSLHQYLIPFWSLMTYGFIVFQEKLCVSYQEVISWKGSQRMEMFCLTHCTLSYQNKQVCFVRCFFFFSIFDVLQLYIYIYKGILLMRAKS